MPDEARKLAMASIQKEYLSQRLLSSEAIELENKGRNAFYNLLEKQ